MKGSYYEDIANAKACGTLGLLFRWEASIYKLLWRQMLIYFSLYIALGLLYKYGLDDKTQKPTFETICLCCSRYADSIPVVLMLGFFTASVMQRWWAVHATIPGTGRIITLATCYMKRDKPESSKWLRTLSRYILVSWLLAMMNVCQPIRRKFPTLESMERDGLLLRHESEMLEQISKKEGFSRLSLYVVNWALLLAREGRDQDMFESSSDFPRLLDPILAFKKSCSAVLKFQTTAIPLSFIQAVALTVHAFGVVSLMGRQFYDFSAKPPKLVMDVYLPILPTIQYLAYVCWLKLAEVAVNPFGEDDDDFDMIQLFENHVEMAGELLQLLELGVNSPIRESLKNSHLSMFAVSDDPNFWAFKTRADLPYADDPETVELIVKDSRDP